jgi:hypothetical protein
MGLFRTRIICTETAHARSSYSFRTIENITLRGVSAFWRKTEIQSRTTPKEGPIKGAEEPCQSNFGSEYLTEIKARRGYRGHKTGETRERASQRGEC